MNSVLLALALLSAYPQLKTGDHRFGIGDGYVAHRGTLTFEKLAGRGGLVEAWLYYNENQVASFEWHVPAGLNFWKTEFVNDGYNAATFRGLNELMGDKESPFQPLDYTIGTATVPEPSSLALAIAGVLCCGVFFSRRHDRFQPGQVVQHKIEGRKFIVLRTVLIPWGGYLVRGSALGIYYRRRFRHFELERISR